MCGVMGVRVTYQLLIISIMTNEENSAIINVLLERPTNINISGRSFRIMPISLGKSLLMSKYASLIKFDGQRVQRDPLAELVHACQSSRSAVSQLLAIYVTDKRSLILDDDYINDTAQFISDNLNDAEMATLLQMYFDQPSISYYMKLLGIDKERDKLHKIQKVKDNSNSVQIGGVSMFGTIIDAACQKYHWTYDYVVWGISYMSLQLMMADSVQTIYLNDKERAKAHISTDGINLSGDNKEQVELMKKLVEQS